MMRRNGPANWKVRGSVLGIGGVLTLAGVHGIFWPSSPGAILHSLAFALVGLAILTLCSSLWLPNSGSRGTVRRWGRKTTRRDGVASSLDVLRSSSSWAMRRKTAALAPPTRTMSRVQRARVPIKSIATPVARVGLPFIGPRVWSPIEDVTLRLGGPRTGKSGELACRILDAPGACVVTSTRVDLLELTAPIRRNVGPVWVFNPSGLGDVPSTVTFDPLAGCKVWKVATQRAGDLITGAEPPAGMTSNDREFWALQARRVLTTLMHAAAVGGLSMRDVLRWVASPDEAGQEISRLLAKSTAQSVDDNALQFLTTNPNTRTSITSTMMPALEWLSDDTAAAAAGQSVDAQVVLTPDGVDTPPAPAVFSAEELISAMGTVYLLGRHEEHIGPLVTAFTADIARKARDMANRMPGGRLSPALTFALDEAALICPIPLDDWTADMGGRNITIHIAAQSLPQIRKRWGHDGAAAILNNANTVLLFGGTRDPDDLQGWATLIGERDELVPSYDAHGGLSGQSTRRAPILSPAQIANLPERRVVIVRRGMPPAIGTVEWAWKRRAVRVALRAQPDQTPAAAAVSSWSQVTEVQSAAAASGSSGVAGASTAEPPRKGSEDRSAEGHAARPRSEPSSA